MSKLLDESNNGLTVVQLGNPQLRQLSREIATPPSAAIQTLIDQLLTTVQAEHGVGIAAPQVGENVRLIIIASRPNLRYPNAPKMEPTPMLNPQLLSHSIDTVNGWEGCLSVPGIRGLVPRYREIEIAYQDRWGEHHRQVLKDFVARIFQHELDHLEGRVFLDRVESTLDLMSEAEYQKRVVVG
ncbi:MAG: peptide deformylase [Cyanobacteria bacterium J06635_1]